jgi:hypothetical protein
MLGELSLSTATLATDRTAECSHTGVQLHMSYTMLFEGIRPLECFTTVITQVGTLIDVHIVYMSDVVLLAACLV